MRVVCERGLCPRRHSPRSHTKTCELPEAVRSHKRTNSYKGNQFTPYSHVSKAYFSAVIAYNHLAYSSFNSFLYSLSNFCTLGSMMNVQ